LWHPAHDEDDSSLPREVSDDDVFATVYQLEAMLASESLPEGAQELIERMRDIATGAPPYDSVDEQLAEAVPHLVLLRLLWREGARDAASGEALGTGLTTLGDHLAHVGRACLETAAEIRSEDATD
jgi:hypothetical protein